MKALPLLPSGLAALWGFVSTPLPAHDFPALTDASGKVRRVIATNDDYDYALVARIDEPTPSESNPAASDVWLEAPKIPTPKTDAVRESQGEGRSSIDIHEGPAVIKKVRIEVTPYPLSESDFLERFGGPAPLAMPAYQKVDVYSLGPFNFQISGELLPLPQTVFYNADPPLDKVPTGLWILGPAKSKDRVLKDFLVPLTTAAAEAAAGFPGEVIDEVIVPVPSEIFLVLDKLGKPDWKAQLRSGKQPSLSNRIDVALLLGNVVAEGFVAVQAEDRTAVEQIGKDVLRLSESLGLRETVLPHTNSILEASKHNHWEIVRVELDKTQKTVRDTMEQHRDAELAQCVSLGGWLRGTEAVTDLINKNYTSDSAELLNQPDIVRHFQKELKKLATKNEKLKNMLAGLQSIAGVIGNGDEPPNAGGVQSIHATTARLVKSIATPSK